jgi:hypothetical protein
MDFRRKSVFAFLLLLLGVTELWASDYSLDNTCKSCTRREMDSLNVHQRRPIRVNQAGFRPVDNKRALVADPVEKLFKVINVETGKEAMSGTLVSLGTVAKPGMWVNGAFNSIVSVYSFGDSSKTTLGTEEIYEADFSDLSAVGRYAVVVGTDTSAVFRVDGKVFNYLFENTLRFFGAQRCGDTDSWFHGACHLQDGSARGEAGSLAGGWHDCGDHFKVGETIGFSAFMLTLSYVAYPERAEDFFGASYNDTLPYGTDGIPDLLWEAKVGADFIFKLYKASKADGLIDVADMYHSVGVATADHQYWDLPERQDAQPAGRGGPDRVLTKGTGANVAGMMAASLALFSYGWELFDKVYADSLRDAAIDIYDNVVMKKLGVGTSGNGEFYTGGGRTDDDPAAAALALLIVTKDNRFLYDLLENKSIYNNPVDVNVAQPDGFFNAGHFGNSSGFYHGGWTTDYQNIHAPVMYAFAKLVLGTEAKAASYGISAGRRDSLLGDAVFVLRRSINDGSNGNTTVSTKDGQAIHVDKPYGGVFTSEDWGYNRYNLGLVNELFMFYDLTGEKVYYDIAMDNMYYNLGMNPWDISFVMGAGDKNLQHPHNRAANPDGYNAGGFPYEYKCPVGAIMGGARPNALLREDWQKYDVTETCSDFAATFLFPTQMNAQDLPPDNEGPLLSNVTATPISATEAVIAWQANELANVTVYLAEKANGTVFDTLYASGLSKAGSVQASGLTEGKTYYFYLEAMDIRRNTSSDDNHGQWYSFVMKSSAATISDVRICQVDDQTAKIYWWTANGAYNTTVRYGTSAAALDQTHVGDNGQPVMFHEALLTGLTPGTTYSFDVVSGSTTDNNGGKHYSFTTEAHAVYVNYDVTIKPVNKQNPGADFFLQIYNNEAIAYEDLEVRFYFKTTGVAASAISARLDIKEIIDVSGSPTTAPYTISVGTAQPVAGTDQYYLPILIDGVLPVAGRAKIEMVLLNGWSPLPWTALDADSWSLQAHSDPVNFAGVDIQKAIDNLYTNDQTTEVVNGVREVTFVKDPFITAHFNGKHVYGYPPDYADGNMPVSKRNMYMLFSSPMASPQTILEQTGYTANFTGTAWTTPIGKMDRLEMNALNLTSSALQYPISGRTDSITFSHTVDKLAYGANRNEFVAWYNADANASGSYDCACAYKRLAIEVDSIMIEREKRYVRMVPSDTVSFYQGKRRLVKVTVTDSSGSVVTDESYTLDLAAALPGFVFWSDPTSTVYVTRVVLTNGVGEFYVGFAGEVTDTLSTLLEASIENPLSTLQYIVDAPLLVAQPLPPWPIIESAKMLDTNCDQIPDALDVVMSTDFTAGKYDFARVEIEYMGDTLVLKEKTTTATNTLRLPFTPPDFSVNTAPAGQVRLVVNVSGQGEKNSEEAYQDGIGPTVLSVAILENLEGAARDSFYVQFSEPVTAGTGWMFDVYDASGKAMAATDTPSVVGAKLVDNVRNIWVYVIEGVGGAKQPIQAGMQLQLRAGATLTDRNGNGVAACTFKKLTVTLKRHPIPMEYAAISDDDGDGRAEIVRIKFTKAVDELHKPDRVQAVFGFFEAETLVVDQFTWNTDRTEAVLQLAQPFKLGNTAGTYSGVYEGKDLINAGWVSQEKGSGADFEAQGLVAADKVGPVLLTATLTAQNPYVLEVEFSEPLETLTDSVGKELLVRERGGSVNFEPKSWTMSGQYKARYLYLETSAGALLEGDQTRFHTSASRYVDESGNAPAKENPWVTVQGENRAQIAIDFNMVKPVQRGGKPSGYGTFAPAANEYFRLVLLNTTTGKYDVWHKGAMVQEGVDTSAYHFQGPTFDFDMVVPRGTASHQSPAWDSVAVSLDAYVYSNQGSFVNQTAESFVLRDGRYLGEGNHVHAYLEWMNPKGKGPLSGKGRSVGTGAYVGRLVVGGHMAARKNASVDESVRARFDGVAVSESADIIFGYAR